jgi:hypothetical protein
MPIRTAPATQSAETVPAMWNNDELASSSSNMDKKSFDSFTGTGFDGMDQKRRRRRRSFDTFTGAGFSGLDKRSFDSLIGGTGFTGLDKKKRAFDSLIGGTGFTGLDKRAFDTFTGAGFNGMDKRSRYNDY